MSTLVQANASEVLSALKFENVGNAIPGSPAKLKPTEATIDFIQSLIDEDKTISVGSGGEITFE